MDPFFTFELGFWNAWILQLIYFFISMSPVFVKRIFKKNSKKDIKKLKNISPTNVKETMYAKILYWLLFVIFIISFIVTFFLPLRFDTNWFYLGLGLFLIGIIVIMFVIQSWIEVKPNKPITKGIYKYSRHPMYISFFFSYIGITITTLSFVFLVLTIVHISLTFLQARSEEAYCLSKFGKSYQEYVNKTPRWIGLYGSKNK